MTKAPSSGVVRGLGALIAIGAGCAVIASFAFESTKYPGALVVQLLETWALLGLFAISAVSVGTLVVRGLSPIAERDGMWALSFCTGALLFATSIGLFGWCGWLTPAFFWLAPLAFLIVGARSLIVQLQASVLRWRREAFALSPFEVPALAFAAICLAMLGLQVINPDNISFDAGWYHLRAAERYSLAGQIMRTPEGDQLLALPQTGSWLYIWAFLRPGDATTNAKVVLALHLELAILLGTLALIPPLVRSFHTGLSPRETRLSWAAAFFFPSLFIYDTGLMGGADHLVGLWSAALMLTWFQARARIDWQSWALIGIQLAGCLAKYSSIYLLVPLVPVVVLDWLWRWRTAPLFSRLQKLGPVVAGGVALALSSPYWLRNWIWYRNPVYPMLSGIFANDPWTQDAAAWAAYYAESNTFAEFGNLTHRAGATILAMWDYHAKIYSWSDMVGGLPVFGSAYFLSVLTLPFIAKNGRLLVLALIIHGGIAVWFNTHQHHMRYLLVLMPLMAAAVAATALYVWRLHPWLGKLAVLGSAALLLVAYFDVPFRHTHRTARGSSPFENGADLIARKAGQNYRISSWEEVGASLPPHAKPLLHGIVAPLGLGRQSITDCVGLQYGVNYSRWGSFAQIHRELRALGVTHLVWADVTEQPDSIAGEALFLAFARQTLNQRTVRIFRVGELPPEPPPEPKDTVLYLGCGDAYPTALYTLQQLSEPLPPRFHPWPHLRPVETAPDWNLLLPKANFVVQETGCGFPASLQDFSFLADQTGFFPTRKYYLRHGG